MEFAQKLASCNKSASFTKMKELLYHIRFNKVRPNVKLRAAAKPLGSRASFADPEGGRRGQLRQHPDQQARFQARGRT